MEIPEAFKQPQRVLYIEDDPFYSDLVSKRLRRAGFVVQVVETEQAALTALQTEHFHVALVDLHLTHNMAQKHGEALLSFIHSSPLHKNLVTMVLTAYPDEDNLLKAFQQYKVHRYFRKKDPDYVQQIIDAIPAALAEIGLSNFGLQYEANSHHRLDEIATTLRDAESMSVPAEHLAYQVQDLFNKLFPHEDRLFIARLPEGLTKSQIVRAQPTKDNIVGQNYVVKLARRDKIETESARYEKSVRGRLTGGAVTALSAAYTRDLGAICYSFAENDSGSPLVEFDIFYRDARSTRVIVHSLRHLLLRTCSVWYDNNAPRANAYLPDLYYDAFNLRRDYLIERIGEALPGFDPDAPTIRLDIAPDVLVTNPIKWLERNHDLCVMPVRRAITHGDLNGRNIMVDMENLMIRERQGARTLEFHKCWLIDFFRTYESHILRDIVILETDIKYRLLPRPPLPEFAALEKALREPEWSVQAQPPEVRRAAQVVRALRQMAFQLQGQRSRRQEYLLSLLMGTLNVVRLRHMERERKQHALLSAAMLCAELDELANRKGRWPILPE
ncbi:MAG: response regulator [Chloroflexi bacterium]|nr:response regulator [Chloroflexota bacterium]